MADEFTLREFSQFLAEPLETRTMFNGADGPIVLTGTDGPDKIDVYYGQLAGGNWIYNYNVNGVGNGLYDFDASKIVINGKGGDDKINIWSLPFVPVTINAGDGNDTINLPGVRQICNMNIDGGTGSNTLNQNLEFLQCKALSLTSSWTTRSTSAATALPRSSPPSGSATIGSSPFCAFSSPSTPRGRKSATKR